MKFKKTLLFGIVFASCAGLGWLLHYYTVTQQDVTIPETTDYAQVINETQIPPVAPQRTATDAPQAPSGGRTYNPSKMERASMPIPVFQHHLTIQPTSEKILDKTRGLTGLSSPQFSPDSKKIIFSAGVEKNHDIWLIDAEGTNLVRLSDSDADEIDPSWMGDGNRIVYSSNETGIYELRILNVDGSGSIRITSDGRFDKYHPRCSPIMWENYAPDRKNELTILFQATNDSTSGIWLVGEDGAYPTPVVTDMEQGMKHFHPEWSPHGLSCIYTREQNSRTTLCQGWDAEEYHGGPIRHRIQALPVENGAQYPVYVSNGTKLVFLNPGADRSSLWYAAVDGSHVEKLTLKREIRGGVGWSPDGSGFAYVTSIDGKECLVIQKVYYPLQDVSNLWQYSDYRANALDLLEKNRFVVLAKEHPLFHVLYEQYSGYFPHYTYATPMFVTVDTTLELFHLFFDYTLRTAEETQFFPLLRELLDGCGKETAAMSKKGVSPEMKNDAAFLADYFSVTRALLSESPETVNDTVKRELALIEKNEGASMSPVLGVIIDYTQFAVRGHYTRSDSMKRYFKAMMWLGKTAFRAESPDDPDKARIETRRALILTFILRNNQELMNAWDRLYQPLLLFVGGADDLTVTDYRRIMSGVFTENKPEEFYDNRKLDRFLSRVCEEKAPLIAPQDGRSFRLMPQRFTPDSYIHQNLVYDAVGTPDNPRLLPRGLDIMAVLGSERAYEILDRVLGETKYERYGTQVMTLKEEFARVSPEEWWENIYKSWLYTLTGLFPDYKEPYPPFMQNTAWKDKSLSTALASWTELRHDTILYVKQSSAEAGEGAEGWMPMVPKPKGYVEPNPEFFRRLKKLITMTSDGLKKQDLYPGELSGKTEKFLEIVTRLETLAEKEINSIPLTEEDHDFIKRYGSELEYMTIFLYGESFLQIGEGEVSLIADVATDRINNRILHEAVGKVREMDVIVPIEGKNQLNKGGVFTYYEFPVEGKRLNDDEWRLMLKEGKAPQLPVWTNSFIARD